MYDYTARLFNYRKASDALRHGKLLHFLPSNEVYVYFRYTDTDCVMVVINNNAADQTLDTARYEEMLSRYTSGRNIIDNQKIDLGSIPAKAKQAMVIELR